MIISSSEVITLISGAKLIETLFKRVNIDTDIPVLTKMDLVNYVKKDQEENCNALLTLKKIYAGKYESQPFESFKNFTGKLADVFIRNPDIGWLGVVKNEYEMEVLLIAVKFLLVVNNLDILLDKAEGYKLQDDYSDRMETVFKKIRFNKKIAYDIQRNITCAFYNYWETNCSKNDKEFTKKCSSLFVPSIDFDIWTSYIEFEQGNNVEEGSDYFHYMNYFRLDEGLKCFLPQLLDNLSSIYLNLKTKYSSLGKFFRSPERLVYFLNSLEMLGGNTNNGIGFLEDGSLIIKNKYNFIEYYRVPKKVNTLSSDVRDKIAASYPKPMGNRFYFDLYEHENISQVNSFIKKSLSALQLKPLRLLKQFYTPNIMAYGNEHNQDRGDYIDILLHADDENQILAIRYLWFSQRNTFLDHPGTFKTSLHWTVTPEGETVRISERNSRMNLLCAIKLYMVWLDSDKFSSQREFDDLVENNTTLQFVKSARRTYIGSVNDKTSSLYQTYISYLNGRMTKLQMGNYLNSRWNEYILKINRKLNMNINSYRLNV